jgi:nucleoside-diphosphate-sugar epimerase
MGITMSKLEKVFVTGATGFLGSHLVDCLTKRGAAISVLVRSQPDRIEKKGTHLCVVRGDLSHPFLISDASTVFHLAAISHVGHALENPRQTFETNTSGTLTVLEAVRRSSSVERLVFVSSAHVYGTPRYVPIDEGHPVRAQEPYAASKLAAEAFVSAYSSAYGIPIAIARLFNTYGPRQHPDFVIPSIVKRALTQDSLTLGNLTPTRDFTYVDDVVEALLRLAESGEGIYNVASGVEVSIETLVTRVAEILGKPLTISSQHAQRRSAAVEIERMWADISRIKTLGWDPRVSLIDGLTKTIAWHRDHP